MGRVNVPGTQPHVPGTRNSANSHQSRNVPGVPGVPPFRARVRVIASRTRTHKLFPVRAYREHPEHPEHANNGKASGCSVYPEHEMYTRNIAKMTKPLRETMPETAAFIDACREAFGAAQVNASIKAGIEGQPTFWASENGITVGTKSIDRGISLSQLQIGPLKAIVQAEGRK